MLRSLFRSAFMPGFLLALAVASLCAQGPDCTHSTHCVETPSFVASLTSFRTSSQSRTKLVSATLRFHNKSAKPLILGYVAKSGVATDDRGNRYVVYGANGVRGIGEIAGRSFDSRFTLPPGESRDARLELIWKPSSRDIFGVQFVLDLAIREIDPVGVDQFRMGAEHALHFTELSDGLTTPQPSLSAQPVTPPASPGAQPVDPCTGNPRCANAGPFYAEVRGITSARVGNFKDHVLRIDVVFHNTSAEPLALGYTARSSSATDNLGNPYYWGRAGTYDQSATGIGVVSSQKANASFVINPASSRRASFQLHRYRPGNNPIGTYFTWNLSIEELQVLSSEQVRSLREHALSFTGLTASGASGNAADESVQKLKDLFRKKK